MKKLTEQDYSVRVQSFSCCFAEKACKVVDKLKLGICCEELIKELKILSMMLEVLKCYDMDDTLTIEEQDEENCVSYSKILSIIAYFVEACNSCFEPAGTEYILCDE